MQNPFPEDCGTVVILEGQVTVAGGDSAGTGGTGIGGGATRDSSPISSGGTVILLGRDVTVKGGDRNGTDIGGGGYGTGSSPNPNVGQGIKPSGDGDGTYTVYGSLTLPCNITLPAETTLTIPEGTSLTVETGTTLTNEGTILVNGGTLTGDVGGDVRYPSTVTVSLADSDGSPLGNTAVYGDTITITATISRAGSSGGNALAAADGHQVVFTIDGQEQTPVDIASSSGTYTATMPYTVGSMPGDTACTITASFEGIPGDDTGVGLIGSSAAPPSPSPGPTKAPPPPHGQRGHGHRRHPDTHHRPRPGRCGVRLYHGRRD